LEAPGLIGQRIVSPLLLLLFVFGVSLNPKDKAQKDPCPLCFRQKRRVRAHIGGSSAAALADKTRRQCVCWCLVCVPVPCALPKKRGRRSISDRCIDPNHSSFHQTIDRSIDPITSSHTRKKKQGRKKHTSSTHEASSSKRGHPSHTHTRPLDTHNNNTHERCVDGFWIDSMDGYRFPRLCVMVSFRRLCVMVKGLRSTRGDRSESTDRPACWSASATNCVLSSSI
jgi:hypothetical protein